MEAVGQNADRAAGVAERDLRDGDGEIQDEDAKETRETAVPVTGRWLTARPRAARGRRLATGVPSCQNTRAVGTGHQRTCTLPMM